MVSRVLPGMGLNGFWNRGDDWKEGGDANWLKISVLSQLVVESVSVALPSSPANGVVHVVPQSDATNKGKVAVRDAGAWVYLSPPVGAYAWVKDVNKRMRFAGDAWVDDGSGGSAQPGEIMVFDTMPLDPPLYTLFLVRGGEETNLPVVASFVATSGVASPVPITSFTATDDVGVTGYWIGESGGIPSLTDPKWSETPQTSYITESTGSLMLYARVRDAAGNISNAATQTITIPSGIMPVEIEWPYDQAVHTSLFSVQANSPTSSVALVYTPTTSRKLSEVEIPMRREIDGAYPGTANVTLEVRSDSPTGLLLGSTDTVPFSDGTVSTRTFTFATGVVLQPDVAHFLVLKLTDVSGGQALYRLLTRLGSGTTWSNPTGSWASYNAQSPLRMEFSET